MTPMPKKTEAQNEIDSQLRPNSILKYQVAYKEFMKWKKSKNARSFSETVFLDYFKELDNSYKPSTLWSIYFMLKSTVMTNNDIDLKTYSNLLAFLRRRSEGYTSRKSKALSRPDIEKFLKEAPDKHFLATKVALIFGVTGACKLRQLHSIKTKDVETHGEMILVKVANTNKKISRSFTIYGPFYEIVKKYQDLRPKKVQHDRFFLNFQKGKCTIQPIGINKFGAIPKQIAKFLGLPEASSYDGRSLLLADSGIAKFNRSLAK